MPMSTESNAPHPWPFPSHDSPDVARLQSRLPSLLSVIAGMVDVIGYLSLGKLFTAHVTGNLVVIAALLVRGGPPNLAQVLAVPVFKQPDRFPGQTPPAVGLQPGDALRARQERRGRNRGHAPA